MIARTMIRLLGLGMFVSGLLLTAWIGYNLFFNETPEFREASAGATRPGKAIAFGVVVAAVGLGLLRSGRKRKAREARSDPGAGAPDGEALAEVRAMAARGRKIDAIKQYRQLTGAGLAEAKRAVEELMRKAA